ncbi:alpha/beta fold hydrolase [Rhodococcoides kyotonense]|uniref:Sigma-B regulation protein RsbQ n=1 Tax=Rhodococcoides kyotonense TaxID=398843 RepID=A0A239HAE9_9NOCA|nr:alpha/beta hydrolase [Rhodococcus kyotonensis]SNS78105.1 sigma-B regulation protein RsbQ [Rhodococcus kyotonensis]
MNVRVKNNVTTVGVDGGPTVMLAHGFGCDQNLWRSVTDLLAPHCRVVLFDHVGAGKSDFSQWTEERYSSLESFADDVVDIVRELDLRNVVYVGHSVASMIGVLAAVGRPDLFDKLVLVTPSPRYIDDGDYRGGFTEADIDELLESMDSNYLGWSRAMAPTIMGNPERPELGEELSDSFCRTDPACARAFARATFLSDNRADLGRVTTPTLIIECAYDSLAPREVGRFVNDSIRGSALVTLDAHGHCPHVSDPEATAAAILSFVGDA